MSTIDAVIELLKELEAKNAALESENAALEAKNAALEGKNAALEGKNAALEGKNAALEGKNAALESENDVLKAKTKELESENDALESENFSLEKMMTELNTEMMKLKSDSMASVRIGVALDLKQQVKTLEKELKKIERCLTYSLEKTIIQNVRSNDMTLHLKKGLQEVIRRHNWFVHNYKEEDRDLPDDNSIVEIGLNEKMNLPSSGVSYIDETCISEDWLSHILGIGEEDLPYIERIVDTISPRLRQVGYSLMG
jgi:chromosome segregation ATPase